MSVGFCRDNLDLNKNSIIENKKKEFYVFDLFDGELYSSHLPGLFNKYVPDDNLFKENDVVGVQIDLESGVIEFFKNSVSLGLAFNEGGSFKKGKLYPFVAIYKCMISVYQPYMNVMVRKDDRSTFGFNDSNQAAQVQMQATKDLVSGFLGATP